MKRNVYKALILLSSFSMMRANDVTSHSFFTVRPQGQFDSPEARVMFGPERLNMGKSPLGGSVEVFVFGGKSTKSCDIGKYFAPFGKNRLNVLEYKLDVTDTIGAGLDSDNDDPSKNIEARNFNIVTASTTSTFASTISLMPEQSVIGVGFGYKQVLWRCKETDNPRIWLDVSFPVEKVSNSMGLRETSTSDGGGAAAVTGLDGAPVVGNMIAAFNQSNWNYGKINGTKHHTKWGVADVDVRLGWASVMGECCKVSSYIGFVAPTGTHINRKNAEYVFNAVIGNNHHWGILYGTTFNIDFWSRGSHSLEMSYNLTGRYLFSNKQVRSFDLKQKQWGRYLAVYSTQAQAQTAFSTGDDFSGTSGINVFTQCVKVEPRFSATVDSALIYRYCNWNLQLGYNLFVRHAEKVCLASTWNQSVAIKAINGLGGTSLARTIAKNFVGSDIAGSSTEANYTQAIISAGDLDLASAAHPTILSNIIYGGAGYEWSDWSYPLFVNAGGSYEFSQVNTVLNRWTAWGKVGISF